jgi:tetratricopeptide (TPR) repeat protein
MYGLPLACAVAITLAAGALPAQDSRTAAQHRERGVSLMTSGDSAAALAAFRAAVALDPADAVSHDAIGVLVADNGDLPAAIVSFRESIRLDPGLAAAHFHLALALERTGHANDAIQSYARALRLRADLVEARYGLSSAAAALGDYDGAITLLRLVIASLPQAPEPKYNLGIYYWRRYKSARGPRHASDLDDALAALKAAIALAPDQARFHSALGRLLVDRLDIDGAIDSLRRARALEPGRMEHAYDLGLALRVAGDFAGAEDQIRAVTAADPDDGLARRALALLLRTKGDLPAAATELRAAVAALPDDAQAYHLLGSVLLKLDDAPAGLEQLKRAITLDPSLVEARVTLAQALARAGRRAEAREQQDAVERINGGKAALGRAMLLVDSATDALKRARPADAVPLLREAVALAPALAEAHFQLAMALKQGQARRSSRTAAAVGRSPGDEVDVELRRAVELEPSHAPAHVELGLRHASRGEIPSAIDALRRAVMLAPGLVAAQRALADLAVRQGDRPTAVGAFEAVLAWVPEDVPAAVALSSVLARQHDCAGANALVQRVARVDSKRTGSERELLAELKRCGLEPPAPGALQATRRAREELEPALIPERVMVCMGCNAAAPRVLRTGARIAGRLGARCQIRRFRLSRDAAPSGGYLIRRSA